MNKLRKNRHVTASSEFALVENPLPQMITTIRFVTPGIIFRHARRNPGTGAKSSVQRNYFQVYALSFDLQKNQDGVLQKSRRYLEKNQDLTFKKDEDVTLEKDQHIILKKVRMGGTSKGDQCKGLTYHERFPVKPSKRNNQSCSWCYLIGVVLLDLALAPPDAFSSPLLVVVEIAKDTTCDSLIASCFLLRFCDFCLELQNRYKTVGSISRQTNKFYLFDAPLPPPFHLLFLGLNC
uniref:Uncharacterized protein n=1 Tax=Romanomermis culicivorax TaxID=13658 RepID=A0A915KUU4_ROMCU